MKIHHLRKQYEKGTLSLKDLSSDPYLEFETWLNRAIKRKVKEPTAMALATATKGGEPSCRMVLLKEWSKKGALFFTNYNSQKSVDLAQNPRACCTIWWKELEQQVIFEGTVKRCPRKVSEEYFHSRPYITQIATICSHQSEELSSREPLEEAVKQAKRRYKQGSVPLPPSWGGFIIQPTSFQFWQGRKDRLHDRFLYTKAKRGWQITRLYP